MARRRRTLVLLLLVLPLACGDNDSEPPCTPGESRVREDACGACDTGTLTEVCAASGCWEPRLCEAPLDADGDTVPNEGCDSWPGGCCTTARDCNDTDPDVHPATFSCVYRAFPGVPDAENCTRPGGGTGAHMCEEDCTWGECYPPP